MVILLVEDNPDDAALARLALSECAGPVELVHAEDGAQAIDYMFAQGRFAGRDASDLPRVVLLDLKLPKVDGLEVLRRIKGDQRTRLVPVVVLSSSSQESDVRQSYERGVNGYVVKPVGFEEYVGEILQVGRYWASVNRTCAPAANMETESAAESG